MESLKFENPETKETVTIEVRIHEDSYDIESDVPDWLSIDTIEDEITLIVEEIEAMRYGVSKFGYGAVYWI